MKTITAAATLRQQLGEVRNAGKSIGFVPTMGALHPGHASLVSRARSENDVVVVSIFVNPTQFNDPNDLRHYPRTPEADAEILIQAGCDLLFMPPPDEMYPPGISIPVPAINWGALDKVMEAAHRPGHFNGVIQVVNRLFEITGSCNAYFGEKDFQQLAVVRRLVADMKIPVSITGCPIMREADGLAMSSRNVRMNAAERKAALVLSRSLFRAREMWSSASPEEITKEVQQILAAEPLVKPEYFEIADASTLLPAGSSQKNNVVACIAAGVGPVRLIDNIILG